MPGTWYALNPLHLVQLFNRVWPISDKDTQQRKEFYKVRLAAYPASAPTHLQKHDANILHT
jgi:hypothetical protein